MSESSRLPTVGPSQARAARIGIAVHGRALRMVGVRSGGRGAEPLVCWAIEGECDPDEPIERAVRELLSGAPMRQWPRPSVVVAFGGHAGQVKPLHGLPAVRDPAVLARIVGATPARYFLRNGVPVTAGGVRVDADGSAWGTAFAAPLVGQLAVAIQSANAELLSLTTLAIALAHALRADERSVETALTWDDEDTTVTALYQSGRLTAVRHQAAGATSVTGAWVPGLAALGEGAERFSAAYGAAVLPPDEPLVLRSEARRRAHVSHRLAMAAVAAGVAIGLALAVAPWRAARVQRAAELQLALRGPRYATALKDEATLAAVDAALRETGAFDARVTSRLQLLERLTTALPEGAALVSLRVDTSETTIVVVAPRMAIVTAALERAGDVGGLALVGAVSREVLNGSAGSRELERATYRLRLTGGRR